MPDLWVDLDTAVTLPVNILPLLDDTDFKSRETAVAYNAAGMDLVWNFQTCAGVTSQTAVTPTTSGDYDWTHSGDGMYKIEEPASGGASINNNVAGVGWFTGIATGVLPWRGPTIGFRAAGLNNLLIDSAHSATRGLSGTALPDAAAEAAGGLFTRGTGAGQINQPANGMIDTNPVRLGGVAQSLTDLKDFADTGYDPVTHKVAGVVLTDTLTTYTGNTPQTGDVFPLASTEIADIKAKTDLIPASPASTTNITAGTITTVTNLTNAPTAGDLTATMKTSVQTAARAALNGLFLANGTLGATGNDTTHVHMSSLTYGNDEINNYLLVIFDVSESEYHSRWIEDWVNASKLATVATLPFTPEASVDLFYLLPIRQDVTGGSGLDAAGVRAAVGLASANLDTQLGDLPTNAELATAFGTADDAVLSAIAALNNLSQANVRTAVGLASANLDTQLDALPTNGELATALGTADDAVLAAIAALNNLAAGAAMTLTSGERDAIAAAFLDLANGIETGLTLRQAQRLQTASAAGKLSGAATTTVVIRNAVADSKNRITATVDADGNRSAITTDVT